MTDHPPQFRYEMQAANWAKDPYYVRWWDEATPITVIATRREDAFRDALEALGDPGRYRVWGLRIRSVAQVTP